MYIKTAEDVREHHIQDILAWNIFVVAFHPFLCHAQGRFSSSKPVFVIDFV